MKRLSCRLMFEQHHDGLTARIEELERQVERLAKALTLMGIAAELVSAPSTPDTCEPAHADLPLTALRPA
jgi:hypothetical protein